MLQKRGMSCFTTIISTLHDSCRITFMYTEQPIGINATQWHHNTKTMLLAQQKTQKPGHTYMMCPNPSLTTTPTSTDTWLWTHTFPLTFSHTHSCTPTTKYAQRKSAWINKRWSWASEPNLWGADSLPHRISRGEWEGHCWLPGNQFVCLLSWCFVSGYSSLQAAHLGHVPLNGIYKT